MNVENPLITYWLSDKSNRPLFTEMINGVIAIKDYELALSLIDQVPASLLNDDIQFIRIDILLAIHAYDDAATALQQISKATPDQPLHNYYIAKVTFLQGKLDVALEHLEKNATHLNVDGVLLKARAEYLSGMLESASNTLRNLESMEPNPQALGLSAMVALDLGNYDEADAFATRALQLNPQQPDTLLAKASVLLFQQNAADADICIKAFLSQLPSSGRGWSVQGQASLLLQDYHKSLSELQTAVQFMPKHIGTWHLLAWNYYLLGLLDNAEQAFNHALNIDDAFADSYGGLAVIAATKGQVEVAQKHIKYATRLSQYSFSAEYAKALLEAALGENDAAAKRISDLLAQNSHLDNISYRELIRKVIKPNVNE